MLDPITVAIHLPACIANLREDSGITGQEEKEKKTNGFVSLEDVVDTA